MVVVVVVVGVGVGGDGGGGGRGEKMFFSSFGTKPPIKTRQWTRNIPAVIIHYPTFLLQHILLQHTLCISITL